MVRPDQPIARVDLGPLAPVREAIDAWRPILRREQPAPQDEPGGPAAQLRRLVWSPLKEHLAGVATVLVSPDGPLGLVPLGALPGQATGSYLIEDYTLALVPVPRLFGAEGAEAADGPKPASAPAEAPSLLLVGDVDYGGDPGVTSTQVASRSAAWDARTGFSPVFERREGMRVEVSAICDSFEEQFPEIRAALLRGGTATEEAMRQMAGKYRYLHLATHGYFVPPELRSALGPSATPTRSGDEPLRRRGSRRVPSRAALGPGAGRGQRPAHPAREG